MDPDAKKMLRGILDYCRLNLSFSNEEIRRLLMAATKPLGIAENQLQYIVYDNARDEIIFRPGINEDMLIAAIKDGKITLEKDPDTGIGTVAFVGKQRYFRFEGSMFESPENLRRKPIFTASLLLKTIDEFLKEDIDAYTYIQEKIS